MLSEFFLPVLFSRAGGCLLLLSGLRERNLWAEWLKHSGLRHSSIPILLSTCLQQMVSGHKWPPTEFSRFTSRMPGRHFDSGPKLNSIHAVCLHETRQAFGISMWECSPHSFNKNLLTFFIWPQAALQKCEHVTFFKSETCKTGLVTL